MNLTGNVVPLVFDASWPLFSTSITKTLPWMAVAMPDGLYVAVIWQPEVAVGSEEPLGVPDTTTDDAYLPTLESVPHKLFCRLSAMFTFMPSANETPSDACERAI